jgi:hypothetical protein
MVEIDKEIKEALEVIALHDMNTHDNIVKAMRLKEEATLTNDWLEGTIQRIIYIQLNTREWRIDTSDKEDDDGNTYCHAMITIRCQLAGEACEKNKKTALICVYANALRTVNTDKWKQEEQANKMKDELIRCRAMLMIVGEYESDWKPSTSKEHEMVVKAKIQLMEEGIIQ